MTMLPSGRVTVTGGVGADGSAALTSVEVYDPMTGTWTLLPPMAGPRWRCTATFVPGHGPLVAGGQTSVLFSEPIQASVELYPRGNPALGAVCVIGDGCASDDCNGGVCVDGSSGAGERFPS